MSSSAVQVVVRLRPMNEKEKKHGTLPVIKAKTQEKSVTVIKGQGSRQARSNYNFDNVFTAFSSQEEVFDATLKPMIRDVMQGYESTVFAYGQTGTGKTYTMEGNLSSPEHYGIIPRSAQAIFEALNKSEFITYNIFCTYLEIYNEELGDLLADDPLVSLSTSSSSTPMKERHSRSSYASLTPMKESRSNHNHGQNKKLEIMNGKNGTFCRGLTERQVNSASDVFELMQRAQQLRKIGETKMNKESSRSHCVFSIIINANRRLNDGSTFEFSGKLHMVDLAGSECAKTAGLDKPTGNDAARERERKNINQSLLTLGRVIKTLKEQSTSSKKSHVRIPYRDSKLTRILQESLGGRCKTLIIATLSPSVTAIEESMSTLSYAQEANGIVNKPVSSSYLSLSSSTSCSMETSGSSEPNSVEHWQEMEVRLEYMQAQVEEAKAALARKHMQQQELVERAEKAEIAASKLENELFIVQEEATQLKESVQKVKEEKETLKTLLKETELTLQKTNAILQATQQTEVCLSSEASAILKTLQKSIDDGDELYSLLSDARKEDINKRNATKKLNSTMESILNQINNQMNFLLEVHQEHQKSITSNISQRESDEENFLLTQSNLLKERNSNINLLSEDIRCLAQDENGIKRRLIEMSTLASGQINETIEFLNQAKVELKDAVEGTRAKTQILSHNLKEASSDYLEKSERVLKTFQSNVGTVKNRIGDMTSNLHTALGQIHCAMSQSRKELHETLTHINDILILNLTSTKTMISEESQHMDDCLQNFREEKKHLGETTSMLNQQKKYIRKHESAYTKEVEELEGIVSCQREMLDKAYIEQRQLQEEFLTNTFTRMQKLLHEEMKRFSELSEKQKGAMESTCKNIISQNVNVDSSAKQLYTNIRGTNEQLLERLNFIEKNEAQLEAAATNSVNVLTKIESHFCNGTSTVEKSIAKSVNHVQNLSVQEEQINKINNDMVNCECEIQTIIDNDLTAQTASGISLMNKEGTTKLDHAEKTAISIADEAIENIVDPQEKMREKVTNNLETMSSNFNDANKILHPIIDEQSTKAENINEILIEHDQKLQHIISSYKDNFSNKNQQIIASTERLGSKTNTLTTSCKSIALDAQSSLDIFYRKQIKADEAVNPLAGRIVLKYSEHFSSTPADEVIIKGLDIPENDETRDSLSSKSEMSCISNNTDNFSSQQSSPSDEIPRHSNEKKPPPLAELSINRENNCESIEKKKSECHGKPRRKGKKRSNPRQPLEYRKRIQLTPSRCVNSKARNIHR